MDADIQFGEVEESAPRPHLRPDRNKHFAVVPCGQPADRDLPIFVDVDALRDMEAHALTDTSVELGGVMLGGQHHDEDGQPFVLVTDSLRAEHYESTKGSFKFTHETWTEITRQRDEFPDDLQMVGWYHTHPDWGVFLSGMDMFICDNFFNKTLDVALVIDPCRDDRGLFQWTGNPSERVRRTEGFYLIGSRFRQHELEWYAAQLEGGFDMARDPRFAGFPQQAGFSPAPVVNIAEQRSPWMPIAVMGMLTMQFLLLAVIAYRILLPQAGTADADPAQVATLKAQQKLIDDLVGDLRVAPDGRGQRGVVDRIQRERERNRQLIDERDGLSALIRERQAEALQAGRKIKDLDTQVGILEAEAAKAKDDWNAQASKIKTLTDRLRQHEPDLAVDDAGNIPAGINWPMMAVIGIVALVLLAGVIVAFTIRPETAIEEETEQIFTDPPDDAASEPADGGESPKSPAEPKDDQADPEGTRT